MSIVRNVYLSEFERMPYKERLLFLLRNEIVITTPEMGSNPLHWCLMDMISIIKLTITIFISPLILALAMNEARILKFRYKGECPSLFFSNMRMTK